MLKCNWTMTTATKKNNANKADNKADNKVDNKVDNKTVNDKAEKATKKTTTKTTVKKTPSKTTVTKKTTVKSTKAKTPSKTKAKTPSKTKSKTPSKTKSKSKKVNDKKKIKPSDVIKTNSKKTETKSKKNNKKSDTKNKGKKNEPKKSKPSNVVDRGSQMANNNTNMSQYFPKTTPASNAKKLQLTQAGKHFMIKPEDAELISDVIKDYVTTPKTKIITDATAGMGGSTINFAKNFKGVHAVEKDKTHFDILKNNVDIYKLNNVDLINKDYSEVYKDLKQDVVFIDAPWGGPKKFKFVRLQLSGIPLTTILNDLDGKASHFVLKVPLNFDFGNFMRGIKYEKVDIKNIPNKNYKILVVYP